MWTTITMMDWVVWDILTKVQALLPIIPTLSSNLTQPIDSSLVSTSPTSKHLLLSMWSCLQLGWPQEITLAPLKVFMTKRLIQATYRNINTPICWTNFSPAKWEITMFSVQLYEFRPTSIAWLLASITAKLRLLHSFIMYSDYYLGHPHDHLQPAILPAQPRPHRRLHLQRHNLGS